MITEKIDGASDLNAELDANFQIEKELDNLAEKLPDEPFNSRRVWQIYKLNWPTQV